MSPCVYLNMTKKGSIKKIFHSSPHELEPVIFGNILEKSFEDIWDSKEYVEFMKKFWRRKILN